MKKQEKCISCGRTFWAKAVKNKVTKQTESLDNICQTCKNGIRQKENAKRSNKPRRIRVIPEQFEKFVKLRELQIAEMERRREEKKKDKLPIKT